MADIALPTLTGSEKQIEWATSIRRSVIHILNDPRTPHTEYIEKAKLITDARWWIDNRHLAKTSTIRNIKSEIRAALRRGDDE